VIEGQGEGSERSTAGPVTGETSENSSPDSVDRAAQVEADLEGLLKERDDYLELAKRTKADFENYRKRMAAEVQAASVRGKAELVGQLIGVIDNLERALVAAGIDLAAEDAPEEPLAQGILLTYRELNGVLARGGVETFDPAGDKFDPVSHEALSTLPAEGVDSGTVVEVLQKGYRLGEQLIRPARVVVAE
jgi:molecular chaperone GrpE